MGTVKSQAKIFTLVLFITIAPTKVFAGDSFFESHVAPGLSRATDSTSLSLLLGGAGAVVGAHQVDPTVRDHWRDHQVWSQSTAKVGDDYGRYAIGAAIALGQTYFDQEKGVQHIRAIVANTIVTNILKYSVRRERPNGSDTLSFPSGHSSDAFASATSLTYAYGWRAGVVAFPVATFVALSRVAEDVHWFSDVTAGALIGVWVGRAAYFLGENSTAVSSNKWSVIPMATADRYELRMTLEY